MDDEWDPSDRRDHGVNGGGGLTNRFDDLLRRVDNALDTPRKRHILGGVMLSASLLFGGLALTIMTIRETDRKE